MDLEDLLLVPGLEEPEILVQVGQQDIPFGGVLIQLPAENPVQVAFVEGPQGPAGPAGSSTDVAGSTVMVVSQSYVDVVFAQSQPNSDWSVVECRIINVTDPSPLNLWPGIITAKTTDGFRVQLNGDPDSENYVLTWAIRPA